jgi:hypothetical protein
MTWGTLISFIGAKNGVSHLKMDVEGTEFAVMRNIIDSNVALPLQISMELHTLADSPSSNAWDIRSKKESEIGLFMDFLFREGGYLLVDRNDNPTCLHCTEILLAKLM